jgi:hypothetical protein
MPSQGPAGKSASHEKQSAVSALTRQANRLTSPQAPSTCTTERSFCARPATAPTRRGVPNGGNAHRPLRGSADADARVQVPGRARRSRPDPGGYPRESQLELAGPEPVTTPAARPAWSQRVGAGGSMMSAACRSARAIRSRGLTLCSSWVSSETSSRNGVRSSTPGSPPVFATRLALAAWAVRRAWSARRPATRPLSRVPSATATSRPVPGLTGVSAAAPGCVSREASACGPSDTTITSLRDPGRAWPA